MREGIALLSGAASNWLASLGVGDRSADADAVCSGAILAEALCAQSTAEGLCVWRRQGEDAMLPQPQSHDGVQCAVACGGDPASGTAATTAFYVISCVDTPLARVANLTLTRLLLQAEGFYVDDAVLYAALADRTHASSAVLLDSVAAFFHAVGGGGGGGGQQPPATEQSAAESAAGVFAALFEELSVSHDVEAFVQAGHPTLPLSCLRCFPSPPSDAVDDDGVGRGSGGPAPPPHLLWSAAETARKGYAAAAAVAASASTTPAPSPTKAPGAAAASSADAASEEDVQGGCGGSEEGSSRAPATEEADEEEEEEEQEEESDGEEEENEAAESVVVVARAAGDRQAEGPAAESVEASPETVASPLPPVPSESRSPSLATVAAAETESLGGGGGGGAVNAADSVFAKRVAELLWDEERLRRRMRDAEREDVSGVPELMKEHRRRIFTSAERTRMAQKLAEIESRMQVRRRELTRLRDERPKASKAIHGHPSKQLHQA